MILVNFVPEKSRGVALHRVASIASPRVTTIAHTILRGLLPIPYRGMRFIVFDSLNAYNFGARLVGNTVDETLSDARGAFRCTSSHARVLHTVAFSVPEVFIREAGWPELNREFMLSLVN